MSNQGGWGGMPQVPQGYNQPGYGYPPNNGGGYGPPQGSPWGPPPGPPPPRQQISGGYNPGYPGASHHQSNAGYPGSFSGGGGYQPPSGPPPPASSHPPNPYPPALYSSPPGPPPQSYSNQAPSGPIGPPQYATQNAHFAPPSGGSGPGQPYFKYSDCSGKRKALCIGINYVGTSAALRGCWNDAKNMRKFLCERYNFRADDIVMLTDEPGASPRQIPTRQNIVDAMSWLVRDARPNDSLFFHYSGHGGQARDESGLEDDGYNETILPLDYKQAGEMIDDEMHARLVRPLPAGCRLTAIYDSCHSATALDLPYIYSTEGKIKEPNLLADAGSTAMGAVGSYLRGDIGGLASGLMNFGKKAMNGDKANEALKAANTSPADVVMWSGCKDSQTSADTQEAGQATGAMSYAFISALTKYPQLTYQQLLNVVRDEMRGRYTQKPQLSSSHPMDTNLLFII